ncbi:MAG: hypothetical protein ACKV2U_30790 [Bryobacteraceae bacterium]
MNARVILIALERYDGGPEWNRLKGPVSDALAFAAWLTANGVNPGQVHVRMSAHDKPTATAGFEKLGVQDIGPATRDAIRKLFHEDLPAWDPGDLIVFWSGHGWFGEKSLCLSASEASDKDMRLIGVDTLLGLLRSDKAKQFKRQTLFFDACAKFKPGDTGADRYVPGKPLEEIEQDSFYAASPGQGAVEKDGAGHFNARFWETLAWPFQPRKIRNQLEETYDEAVRNGITRQQPFTVGFRLGKAPEPTWRGARPRTDALSRFSRRARLTPKLLERLATLSASCLNFTMPESRDPLAVSLSQAVGKPFNRPADLRSSPALDFQMIWAFAREQDLTMQLLTEMDDVEQSSNEIADVREYLDAAAGIAALIEIVAGLGIPSRVWRAWVDEFSTTLEFAAQYDLEDLFEPFFLSANSSPKRRRFLEILARAYRRENSADLLAWLRDQPGWRDDLITAAVPPRQIVHLDAGYTAERGVWIEGVKLWRPRTRSYRTVDLTALGLDAKQVPDIADQFDGLDQELTAKGLIGPEITEIIYELALPAEALNAARCHQPKHAVVFRWLDRLRTKEKTMGAGDWVRFGEDIRLRSNDPKWRPRAKWLALEKCCYDEALCHLRAQGENARELIGLARTIKSAPADLEQLLDVLKSGAPFACWHIDDPGGWDPLELKVQKLLDEDGLDKLPLSLRGARYNHGDLGPMVLFFDDPRRDPYSAHLSGLG